MGTKTRYKSWGISTESERNDNFGHLKSIISMFFWSIILLGYIALYFYLNLNVIVWINPSCTNSVLN